MPSSIVITGIQLNAHCGVTDIERSQPQPILVDLTLRCLNEPAFLSDQITDTVDYAAITQCIRNTGESQTYALLETLAERICQTLFQEFPLTHLKIWVRKIRPPMKDFTGSVGIRLMRSRQDLIQSKHGHPSPFLAALLPRLSKGKVLDVATGRGRHAYFMATQGFSVHGIDRNREALEFLDAQAQEAGQLPITTEYVDLETDDLQPPDLGTEMYDVILVFFYLYRPLFPQLLKALKPGGVILYETFLLENHIHRQHPRRKEFCLETNELLTLLQGLQILHYDEGDHTGTSKTDRAFTARAMARKP
jgi:dihydroneopterin aldolase